VKSVEWFDSDGSPLTGLFAGEAVYSVAIEVEALPGFTFGGGYAVSLNGEPAETSAVDGRNATATFTFPETEDRAVTGMAVVKDPDRLSYATGDAMDLTGLVVALEFEDGTIATLNHEGLARRGVSVSPWHGMTLGYAEHYGAEVSVSCGRFRTTAGTLDVGKAGDSMDASVPTPTTAGVPAYAIDAPPRTAVSEVTWNGSTPSMFVGGTSYTLRFRLTADEGYEFPSWYSVTVGGQPASITRVSDTVLAVSYRFAATYLLVSNRQSVTLTPPALGQAPDYEPSGALEHVAVSEVRWNGSDEVSQFLAGTVYTVSVTLVAETGWMFAQGYSLRINDTPAQMYRVSDTVVIASLAFPATGTPQPIGDDLTS
jgi:hypothetical protein